MGIYKQRSNGFTLVEISIVMIIIGLLIGATFGGMKLIENMNVNRTVQDLKTIESAALTFKDTYGRLPGDMPNTAARLPNCTATPCSIGGNGDRRIGAISTWINMSALTATEEKFTLWHHLAAADLMKSPGSGATLEFGDGQPESPFGGYRLETYVNQSTYTGVSNTLRGHLFIITGLPWEIVTTQPHFSSVPCSVASKIDQTIDDGRSLTGRILAVNNVCYTLPATADSTYNEAISTPTALRVLMRF